MVAESLGGRLISADTKDLEEKQLINIVEEIAIASGVAVPPVYIINEKGINAFAAGYNLNDAVIGVTKGATHHLSRRELQGVIAHEFSHIFNGDMRLNIRLIAILHGVLAISYIGYAMIRGSTTSRYSSRRNSSSSSGGNIVFLGLGLIAIGYIGSFFGNMIKASVSRQREYLADSTAVKFTRDPSSIAGALKKIAALQTGSNITNPKAKEMSHMFFSNAFSSFFGSLMATHPPLNKRILAIDPTWDGNIKSYIKKTEIKKEKKNKITKEKENNRKTASTLSAISSAIENAGTISEESIAAAHIILSEIPQPIKQLTSNPFGARAVIYSLLIQPNSNSYQKQIEVLEKNADEKVYQITSKLHKKISLLDKKHRVTLIDLSLPSLKQLSPNQYKIFTNNINFLIQVDEEIDLFEWCITQIIFNGLGREFKKNYKEAKAKYNIQGIRKESSLILSLVAHAGQKAEAAKDAFLKSTIHRNILGLKFVERDKINLNDLNNAIPKLEQLKPLEKEKLLQSCAICITENGVKSSELELLRAISAVLNCPMPNI